ncbi:MAG: glutamate--tRNA ligase [Candidatus Omnitrophota bacterium]|nr:glutamate--tRNA ligase [Candidatus Omnitrophota bacterium]
MIRVRFAPSPTGYLHIGGVRTALFNWLYAKAQAGKFILRIEDTDKKRSQKKYLDEILDSLKWLGLEWDEIYFQSQRFDIYNQFAKKLLDESKAYQENSAIILKMPQAKIKIDDLIHGLIEFDTSTIKDQVLIKSDATPTYNFACVVDDSDMQISHVIRGDDHISNTPKQIAIYQALGFSLPKFAHLPLILGKDGARLSKRTGATSISDYRGMGYLPEAIVNYLMLLGWSPGNNQEIVAIDEAIKKFSIKRVNKTAATFSLEKLNWINNQYIKKSNTDRILSLLIPFLKSKRFIKDDFDRNYLLNVVKLFQGRINTLEDFINWADFVFLKKPKFEKEAKQKFLAKDLSREFTLLIERLNGLESFDAQLIEAVFRGVVAELNLNASDLVHPVRVALTGKTIGPGLFETIAILGKEKTVERLQQAIKSKKK